MKLQYMTEKQTAFTFAAVILIALVAGIFLGRRAYAYQFTKFGPSSSHILKVNRLTGRAWMIHTSKCDYWYPIYSSEAAYDGSTPFASDLVARHVRKQERERSGE